MAEVILELAKEEDASAMSDEFVPTHKVSPINFFEAGATFGGMTVCANIFDLDMAAKLILPIDAS